MLAESGRKTHAPVYLVGVYSGDLKLAEGASYNIKLAQNEAALAALRQSHGASESDTVLPASWGEYAAEDVSAGAMSSDAVRSRPAGVRRGGAPCVPSNSVRAQSLSRRRFVRFVCVLTSPSVRNPFTSRR